MDERERDARPQAEGDGGERLAEHVLAVRLGHGANCSSIGSVVDTLFASAVVMGAVVAAVAAAMKPESVTVVGRSKAQGHEGDPPRPAPRSTNEDAKVSDAER